MKKTYFKLIQKSSAALTYFQNFRSEIFCIKQGGAPAEHPTPASPWRDSLQKACRGTQSRNREPGARRQEGRFCSFRWSFTALTPVGSGQPSGPQKLRCSARTASHTVRSTFTQSVKLILCSLLLDVSLRPAGNGEHRAAFSTSTVWCFPDEPRIQKWSWRKMKMLLNKKWKAAIQIIKQ